MQATKPRTGGCGCGGGCGGGCGCKPARLPEAAPAICSPCETASFIRPRFFAGQLLTEDDLGALIDYVVAKNRFHNSRLFGTGVVCGLEVECGPCDGSQIIVQPGYALDCCGNDLVLTCKRTLDLAPMIRELAARKDGGCTDPCPPPAPVTGEDKKGDKPEVPPYREYCLYARYAERPDQPVAAYPVGDDCDAVTCEPTRIVEGIVFELRCPPTAKRKTMHDLQDECSWWMDREQDLTRRARVLRLAASAFAIAANQSETEREELELAREVTKQGDALTGGLEGRARFEANTYVGAKLLPLLARFRGGEAPPKGLEGAEQLEARLEKIVDELRASSSEPTLHPLEAHVARALPAYFDALKERRGDVELRELIKAGPFGSPEVMDGFAASLEDVAQKLQREAGCGTSKIHTDCTLSALIDSLKPAWNRRQLDARAYEKARHQFDDAACAIERYLRDCWCAAINPPCPPCDDPGVLLACIKVEHCTVIQICNTVREYVLAPTTLRYWDAIELPPTEACCDEGCDHERKAYAFERPVLSVRDRLAEYAGVERRSREAELIEELQRELAAVKVKLGKLEKRKGES